MVQHKIILTRGIQGSGKSTWAKAWVAESPTTRIRYNSDDMRNMSGPYDYEGVWTNKNNREKALGKVFVAWLQVMMSLGYDIVVDNMNLSDRAVNQVKSVIGSSKYKDDYEIEFKDFFIPVEECIRRDALRPNPIGKKVIKETFRRYRDLIISLSNQKLFAVTEKFEKEQADLKDECIIADMDATICFNTSGRPFFGDGCADKMMDDYPNYPVISIIKSYLKSCSNDDRVFIVTGRTGSDDVMKVTQDYVNKYIGEDERIIILYRPENEYMPGGEMKLKLYNDHIKGKYKVLYALDDSHKVVDAYRSIGMTVLQPNAGNF